MSELAQFKRFCSEMLDLQLEPFQTEVMQAVLSDRREVVISQPRGAGKTTLLGCFALFELVLHPEATIIAAASARDQAQHLYRAASKFAKRVPALRKRFTFTLREIRTPEDGRLIVVSADSEKQIRDHRADYQRAGAKVVGVSPDTVTAQRKFADKYDLDFTLLGDENHEVAELYGVWGEKKMYGKTYMGVQRATFIIDPEGKVAHVIPKASPKTHDDVVLEALGELASA